MKDIHQGSVDSAGIQIHYYRVGERDAPSIILCHGFSDNGLCWQRVADVLKPDFDIIMMDARNHGNSDRGPADLSAMAADVGAVADALALEHPVLMGHSMGASMVAELSASRPDLPAKLILEDPPWTKHQGDNRPEDAEKRAAGFKAFLKSLQDLEDEAIIRQGKLLNPTWHADDLPAWAASKKQVSETAMEGLSLGRWAEPVAALQCPSLLIYAAGEGDGIVSHLVAESVSSMNPRFVLKHIENAGHNTRREQFEPYMEAVKAFLAI